MIGGEACLQFEQILPRVVAVRSDTAQQKSSVFSFAGR